MTKAAAVLRLLRLPFLTVTAGAVLIGTGLAIHATGRWDFVRFLLALFGAACLHAGANAANDYFDYRAGTDAANRSGTRPFSGGSGVLLQGLLRPGEAMGVSALLAACGVGAGLVLHFTSPGGALVPIGLAGLALVYSYNGPPLRLVNAGLGEAAIFLAWGPLMVGGAYYVQAGSLRDPGLPPAAVVSGALTVLVLLVNEFADREADASAGRRTVVTELGYKGALAVWLLLGLCACAAVGAGVAWGGWPLASLAAFAALPALGAAFRRGRAALGRWPEFLAAVRLTVLSSAAFSAILAFTFIVW